MPFCRGMFPQNAAVVDESELNPELDVLVSDLGQVIHLSDPPFPFLGLLSEGINQYV